MTTASEKPPRRERPDDRSLWTFGELLGSHLEFGTRPLIDPSAKVGRPWSVKDFADHFGKSERIVRLWLSGESLPFTNSLTSICDALFSNEKAWENYRFELTEKWKDERKGRKAGKGKKVTSEPATPLGDGSSGEGSTEPETRSPREAESQSELTSPASPVAEPTPAELPITGATSNDPRGEPDKGTSIAIDPPGEVVPRDEIQTPGRPRTEGAPPTQGRPERKPRIGEPAPHDAGRTGDPEPPRIEVAPQVGTEKTGPKEDDKGKQETKDNEHRAAAAPATPPAQPSRRPPVKAIITAALILLIPLMGFYGWNSFGPHESTVTTGPVSAPAPSAGATSPGPERTAPIAPGPSTATPSVPGPIAPAPTTTEPARPGPPTTPAPEKPKDPVGGTASKPSPLPTLPLEAALACVVGEAEIRELVSAQLRQMVADPIVAGDCSRTRNAAIIHVSGIASTLDAGSACSTPEKHVYELALTIDRAGKETASVHPGTRCANRVREMDDRMQREARNDAVLQAARRARELLQETEAH